MSPIGIVKKRSEAGLALATALVTTGAVNGMPLPSLEIPKKVVVMGTDVVLCYRLGKIYFEDDFTAWGLKRALCAVGGVGGLGVLAGYGALQLADALAAEVLNFGGPPGWALSAAVAAGVTLAVGATFWWACDRAKRRGTDIGDELVDIRQQLELLISGERRPDYFSCPQLDLAPVATTSTQSRRGGRLNGRSTGRQFPDQRRLAVAR